MRSPWVALAIAAWTGIVLAAQADAQEQEVARLRRLAATAGDSALRRALRERPDDARELVRLLVIEAGTNGASPPLGLARRIGSAYAAVWADSFPLASVEHFARLDPSARAIKLLADSLRRAGIAAHAREGVVAALALWREAFRRSSDISDSAGMAAALGNIGAGQYLLSRLDSADATLEQARTLAEAVGDRRTAVNALNIMGSVARERGDLRRAQVLYARALDLRSRIGDVRGAAAEQNNLGLLAADLGELGEARTRYETALAMARQHDLDEPAAAALINLANVASAEGEFAEAASRYEDALALYRESGSDAESALVLHNVGLLALRRGDYTSARARLNDALEIFDRTGTDLDRALIRRDLALVAAGAGDLQSSLTHLDDAEHAAEGMSDDLELGADLALARADLAVRLNNFAEAERQFSHAEALYRETGHVAGRSEAQAGRALLLVENEQFGPALELLRSIARAQASSGDRRPAALTRLLIGHALHREGDLEVARQALREAADTLAAIDDAVGEAAALLALGEVEVDAGASLAAEALYRRGLARLEGRPATTVNWQLRAALGRALHRRGANAEAATELRRATDDLEGVAAALPFEERRAAFMSDKWDVYAYLAVVERARGDPAGAFIASERLRARAMLDLLARGRLAPPVAGSEPLLGRWQDLRRQIAELTKRLEMEEGAAGERRGPELSNRSSGATREALARAQERYAELLLRLREDGSAYALVARGEVASWRDVAGRLAPGEVMLEYLVSDSTTLAFMVMPDTLRVVDLNVGRAALEPLVDFARGTLVRPSDDAAALDGRAIPAPPWRAPLRRLHQHLVAPLEATLALEGARRLIIVPHVELHYLPFAALIRRGAADSATGVATEDEFLIERYEIAYAPSASVWLRLGDRPASQGTGVLAVAPRTGALPGSLDEVEAIRTLYGSDATVLTDAAAIEPAFRAAAPLYGVLHVATYGVLNKHNPLFSYVALNAAADDDGRLEVHEVFGLELNARLLVLSACQTALGSGVVSDVPEGDDWVGLVRAFLSVGAANVIATLWPVEDRSTARVMAQLHAGLRAGQSEITALAGAQRAALRDPMVRDPFYWAGFTLAGGR